jgi:hypothetical protein
MGNLRSLNRSLLGPEVAPYGAKRRILWLQICTFAAWSENGHPYVARTLWSWDLATPGVRTGFLEARSSSPRKLAMVEGHLIIIEFGLPAALEPEQVFRVKEKQRMFNQELPKLWSDAIIVGEAAILAVPINLLHLLTIQEPGEFRRRGRQETGPSHRT